MTGRFPGVVALVVATVLVSAALGWSAPVAHTETTVNGLQVDRYAWLDSRGRTRSVFLKKEGNGNPGHGGYAIRMTYQVNDGVGLRTVVADAAPGADGGFGYFVSHERYRDFTDGENGTIGGHVFHADDSPLGLKFPVVGATLALANPDALAHRFTLHYPRYGTVDPIPKKRDGSESDLRRTPVDRAKLKLYSLPVSITWVFQSGMDYPRIQTDVGLGLVGGPDRVNFDLRGPYGVLTFDNGAEGVLKKVVWGDRFHFATAGAPLTRNSGWTWKGRNGGARYHALVAGSYEMGLFEPRPFARSALADGYADERGSTSTAFRAGKGCKYEPQILPCDWEWPYQSAQYSLPYHDRNGATTGKKIAWGSSAFYGTGPSLTRVFDTSATSEPLNGYPASNALAYSVCVVLGQTVPGSLTRQAADGPAFSCAAAAQ